LPLRLNPWSISWLYMVVVKEKEGCTKADWEFFLSK